MRGTAIIIGGGIVGFHVALNLQKSGFQSIIIEKEKFFCHHTSSRNSGVIHAGVFYNPGSLKEMLCIDGNKLTYQLLSKIGVKHKRCGKLIIANNNQKSDFLNLVEKIKSLKISHTVVDDVSSVEPNIKADFGILVHSTGIVDVAEYISAMELYLENHGVILAKDCKILEFQEDRVITSRGNIKFNHVINCAGLWSDDVMGDTSYHIKPMRGDYAIIDDNIISRPVYGLPTSTHGVLGIHMTPTFDNKTLIGPNAFYIDDKNDYRHRTNLSAFVDSIRDYVYNDRLNVRCAYSGNRPKLFCDNVLSSDFVIINRWPWVHLLGIDSPGLTAAPSIGMYVRNIVNSGGI